MREPARGIPAGLNLVLLLAASATAAALLYGAAHASNVVAVVGCAIAFSFVGNTLFSLMHEAVHGVLHPARGINEWAGRLASAWFPTSLSLQRAFHLTHHRYNRSRFEQFDLLHEGDIRWLKKAQWYAILTGLYWFVTVMGVLAYAILPAGLRRGLADRQSEVAGEQTGGSVYAEALEGVEPARARLEIVASFALQVTLFVTLDLTWWSWLACYGAFALNWSSLQYADHAFSVLDRRDGAWNLRVNTLTRLLFLNYHAHLAHHQHPQVSWVHLHALASQGEPGPSFWQVWKSMWLGPVPVEDFHPGQLPSRRPVVRPTPQGSFLGFPRGFDAFSGGALVVLFVFFFLVFYGGASLLSGFVPWRIRVDLPFEQLIPFEPWFAVVYVSTNVLLLMAPFVLRTTRQMVPLFCVMVAQTAVAAALFLFLPVETGFPPRHVEGSASLVFRVADTLNMERNFLPSLHVALAFTAVAAYARQVRGVMVKAALFAWPTAIAVSTLLIHEHHVVDLVAGILLAVVSWRAVAPRAARPEVIQAFDVELLCLREFLRFGRRHRRYWGIALALYKASLPKFRKTRVLRTGFCFLQQVDDLLDGDRPCDGESLDVVDDLVEAIRRDAFGDTGRMRLASAFAADMREMDGERSLRDAIELIQVMMDDRRRVMESRVYTRAELRDHHRRTFSLSVDLMLRAIGSDVSSRDVPGLIDAFGWCSTMRDLEEDLEAGLINIPADIMTAAGLEPENLSDYESVITNEAVVRWMGEELLVARQSLDAADASLEDMGQRPGVRVLKMFSVSIRRFADRTFPRRFPTAQVDLVSA
jgi:fatty acid desaturase/phytoene/squalene synthetase